MNYREGRYLKIKGMKALIEQQLIEDLVSQWNNLEFMDIVMAKLKADVIRQNLRNLIKEYQLEGYSIYTYSKVYDNNIGGLFDGSTIIAERGWG